MIENIIFSLVLQLLNFLINFDNFNINGIWLMQ
jgi:hypothetical protein